MPAGAGVQVRALLARGGWCVCGAGGRDVRMGAGCP
jgi:hypothetical protein